MFARHHSVALLLAIVSCTSVSGASNPGNRRIVTVGRPVGQGSIGPSPVPRARPRPRGRSIPIVRDPALQAWVKGIFEALAIRRSPEKSYRITVLEDDQVNAAALADGHILVFTGLLAFVKSDDELAGILAHECAHVELRHHPKRAGKGAFWQTLLTVAAAAAKNVRAGFLGAQVAAQAMTLSYSRKQELAADRWALERILAAGFNPTAMIDFLDRLRERDKEQPGFLATFMMSHPLVSTRIRQVRRHMPRERSYAPKVLSSSRAKTRAYEPVMNAKRSRVLDDLPVGFGSVRGSIVPNGNFESPGKVALPLGWKALDGGKGRRDVGRAWEGRASLLLPSTNGSDGVSSPSFPLSSGVDHAGSFWLQGRGGGNGLPEVVLVFDDGKQRPVEALVPRLCLRGRTGDWQRLEFRLSHGDFPDSFRSAHLEFRAPKGQTLWIDGLTLQSVGDAYPSPSLVGNLVEKGGFEEGAADAAPEGWILERGKAVLDHERRRSGKAALRMLTTGTGAPTTLAGSIVPIRVPSDLMVAGFLRAVNPGVRCWLGVEILDGSRRPLGRVFGPVAHFAAAGDWTNYRKVLFWGRKLSTEARYARFLVEVAGRTADLPVWVDDLALVMVQNGGGRCSGGSASK